MHCTQTAPLQIRPPFGAVHVVPSALVGCDALPLTQMSSVQPLPSSTGRSVLSGIEVVPPLLSHTSFWQLAMTCSAVVPAAAFENPQVFWFPHTRW